jgi:hypothetical protein
MRLGLLGPANGDLAGLARCAEFLLNTAKVNRAIYLGADDALEDTVALWAESLVGPNPSNEGIWQRALMAAATGSPDEIDAFLRAERARLRLKSLERLPAEQLRTVEMLGDRVAVLVHDKALLDEEDIFSATFLVYGRSTGPHFRKIGSRWFLTPGPIGSEGGGAGVLDDSDEEVMATIYDVHGCTSRSETMTVRRASKLSVQH